MSDNNQNYTQQSERLQESFDKDTWLKQKQKDRNDAFASIDSEVKKFTDIDKLNTYLNVQSRFDKYSVGNAVLIAASKPEAEKLADAKTWQKNGVYIKKGERGITILEPGEEFKREDGSTGVNYNAKKVFDISQTTAEKKSQESKNYDISKIISSLIQSSPVNVCRSSILPDDKNVYFNSRDNAIVIREGIPAEEIVRELSKEIVSLRVGSEKTAEEGTTALRAYAVSYIVCKRYNIEPPGSDFKSKLFDGLNAQAIRSELGKIRSEANSICNNIDRQLKPKAKSGDAR
jgi:hypothetical protein